MLANEYLFPRRLTRRDFIRLGALATTGLATTTRSSAAEAKSPVRLGIGHWTYTLDEQWGRLPAGMSYGLGCGVIVDSKDRVYVTSRSTNPCVAVFDRDGGLLETWSDDFDGKIGFSKIGARVYKTDLKGQILYQIGNVAREGSTSQKFDWTNPTDVAVAPNGDIYVVDGYGSQRVSHFDKNFKHIKTIGGRSPKPGPDADHGTFNTCHGIWINTLNQEPEAYIADRHNDRLEVFDLDLSYKRTLKGDVRNPCCFYQHQGHIYVPDLASRVTIFDAADKVVAQLGEGKSVPNGSMGVQQDVADANPDKFFAPHAMTVDSRGDFYVVEWVAFGRARKFKHTPQA